MREHNICVFDIMQRHQELALLRELLFPTKGNPVSCTVITRVLFSLNFLGIQSVEQARIRRLEICSMTRFTGTNFMTNVRAKLSICPYNIIKLGVSHRFRNYHNIALRKYVEQRNSRILITVFYNNNCFFYTLN